MADTNDPSTESAESLGVGEIISQTLGLFARNFPFFFGVVTVPYFGIYLLTMAVFGTVDPATAGSATEVLLITFGSFMIIMLGYIFIQGVLVRCAIAIHTGHGHQLGLAVSAAFKGFLPILLLGIVAGLMTGVAFLALIVPGLYVAAMVYVFVPAIVFEGQGFSALGRSIELTKGYRWAIVGVLLVFGALIWVITIVAGVIIALFASDYWVSGGTVNNWIGAVIEAVVQGLTLPISMIGTGLVFARLREIKEGGAAEDLVRVFE